MFKNEFRVVTEQAFYPPQGRSRNIVCVHFNVGGLFSTTAYSYQGLRGKEPIPAGIGREVEYILDSPCQFIT